MEIVRNILLVLHFVGLASLFGGFMVQMSAFKSRSARINPAILHGALTQLVTGALLVGVLEMGDADVNHVKIAIKLLVALAIYVVALVFRKKETISNGVLGAIGLLTLVNIVVAVFV